MDRRLQFIAAQTVWTYGAVVVLTMFGVLTFELFFIISLVGFLIIIELTAPYVVEPRWRTRLRWVVGLGFVGFGYIAVRRILSILPSGLL